MRGRRAVAGVVQRDIETGSCGKKIKRQAAGGEHADPRRWRRSGNMRCSVAAPRPRNSEGRVLLRVGVVQEPNAGNREFR